MSLDSSSPPSVPQDQLLGTWLLVSREDYDSSGQRHIDPMLGASPLGILTFSAGWFSAQFMNRDRSQDPSAGALPHPANAAVSNTRAIGGYDAYFGTYGIHGEELVVTLRAALNPADVGKQYVRQVERVGGKLTIRLDTTTLSGTPVTRTLIFTRLG